MKTLLFLAEQRLKDRLAASAREKLSQVDKEKQIKAERKKKAAMFINLLKSQTDAATEEDKTTGMWRYFFLKNNRKL
jgi:hypothetical protein